MYKISYYYLLLETVNYDYGCCKILKKGYNPIRRIEIFWFITTENKKLSHLQLENKYCWEKYIYYISYF